MKFKKKNMKIDIASQHILLTKFLDKNIVQLYDKKENTINLKKLNKGIIELLTYIALDGDVYRKTMSLKLLLETCIMNMNQQT